MMEAVKPPGPLKLTGNVDASYIAAVGVDQRADKRKIAILLTVAGTEAIEAFNTFVFAQPDDRDKFDEVLKNFNEYCH